MFERNKIEAPSKNREKAVPAELLLDDGRVLKGNIFIPATRQLFEELNASGAFLEFEHYAGRRELISKTCIRSVHVADVAKPVNLLVRTQNDNFDPHEVLGVNRGASLAEISEAFRRLSKLYHPDRYATANLPEEVSGYINSMSRRINAAYAALEKPAQKAREISRARSQPIYERVG